MNVNILPLPLQLVAEAKKKRPQIWSIIDGLSQSDQLKDKNIYMASGLLSSFLETTEKGTQEDINVLASELHALSAWRRNKKIYTFHQALASELLAAYDSAAVLPVDVLLDLPFDGIFIECLQKNIYFFVTKDYDVINSASSLSFYFPTLSGFSASLPLLPDLSLEKIIDRSIKKLVEQVYNMNEHLQQHYDFNTKSMQTTQFSYNLHRHKTQFINNLKIALPLLLYLCAQNCENEENAEQKKIYRPRSSGASIKDAQREIKKYDVGYRIGAAIVAHQTKKATDAEDVRERSGTSAPKSAHVRRGHYHHFWTGPRSDRKLILKWVNPSFINFSDFDEMPATIHAVKKNPPDDTQT